MKAKRFFLRCINFIIACCSVLFLTFIGFCITIVIFALVTPLNDHIGWAILIMFSSIVPAVLLTKRFANYCRKKQLPPQTDPAATISEDTPKQDPDFHEEEVPDPEPKKEWDPADDIPDVVQKEYFSDTLFLEAVDIILESRIVSAGRLQSTLKIGANRASRILKEMENLGVIGPEKGNLPREVFFTPDEWKTERKRFVWFPDFPDDPANPPAPKKEESKPVVNKKEPSVTVTHSPAGAFVCRCRRCGGSRVLFNTVKERKSVGCFTIFLCALFMFTFIGWIILLCILFSPKEESVTYATCQDCGMRWRVS